MSFTDTPVPARSAAMDSLQPHSANLLAEYAASWMIPSRPPTLETLTIMPALRASMRGSTARVRCIGPKKLTRMTASTSAAISSVTGRRFGIAALLTSTSIPPRASHASSANWPSPDVSARSATHIAEAGDVLRQAARTSARRSRRRATSPTIAPCAASWRARAAPTPDEAPVMSTRASAAENAMATRLKAVVAEQQRRRPGDALLRVTQQLCPRPAQQRADRLGQRRCRRLRRGPRPQQFDQRRSWVAHDARILVDVKPGKDLRARDRGAQPAELVDQSVLERVGAGPHPAARDRVDVLDGNVAALGNSLHEVVVKQVGLGLDLRTLLVSERRVHRPRVGVGVGAHRVRSDTESLLEVARHQLAGDNADRPGDRSGVGDDRVGAHRHVVAAGRGDCAHRRDHRLAVVADAGDLAPDRLRPGHRTSRAVDAQHDR